jgi:hypothetical protein
MKRWLLVVGLCSCNAALYGSVVFTLGNNPQPDEHGVLLNNGTSGNTVFGTLNGVPGVSVQFSSTQTLLEPTAGLARITVNPETTALENVTISVVGGTFGDLIFNPAIGTVGTAGGTAHVTVNSVDNLGNPEVPSPFDYSLSNGQNFLTITTMGGEKIVDMTIDYPSGFTDLRGVRISAVTIPEPSTFVPLLALAFGSIILIRKPRNV